MAEPAPRKTDLQRWRSAIVRHLEDFPRQYAALEYAMAMFGDDFDLKLFKRAYEDDADPDAYNRVQALERSFARVQNYVADLADNGAKLAGLLTRPATQGAPKIQPVFEALRAAGVFDAKLCRRLVRAQGARSRIEHSYVDVPAGDVHKAALLVHDTAAAFIVPYARWIEPYLVEPVAPQPG